jgi:hypothetical protein
MNPLLPRLPLTRRQALGILATPFVVACFPDKLTSPHFDFADSSGPVTLIGAGDTHAKINNNPAIVTGRLMQRLLDEFNLYDQAWGGFRERTDFQIGNHDLLTDITGTPYYDYAGDLAGTRGKGYYAKTYGSWRCYFLNSQRARAEQTAWLAADLPNWSDYQIMAMWHQPMFASVCAHNHKAMTNAGGLGPWWQLLQDHGAEFVVSGHVHRYERFARMLRDGTASDRGIRQFIVGTGGAGPMNILTVHPKSQVQLITRGVIQLDLYPDRYQWCFSDDRGKVRDSGVEICQRTVSGV